MFNKTKKMVVIGGGTGLFTLLSGLKEYTKDITAIVSIADDGGSSGILRDELGFLPVGDIRSCLIALAESKKLMYNFFNYRFEKGSLAGHSVGNMLIAALTHINNGDFLKTVEQFSSILAIRGKVLPATLEKITLFARLVDGHVIKGQAEIDGYKKYSHIIDLNKLKNRARISEVFIKPMATALPDAIKAIREANVIVLGPGSLYTSIIPNLLIKGIPEALKESKAKKVYVCNIMTQMGETDKFSASDHLNVLEGYMGTGVLTHIIINDGTAPEKLLEKYRKEYQELITPNLDSTRKLKVIKENFIKSSQLVRHDSEKLARIIIGI